MLQWLQRNRIVVSRGFVLLFILVVVTSRSRLEGTIAASLLFVLGLVLIGIATVGRRWCSLYISGHKGDELVTVGPYSLTRNPLYFFSLLGFSGVGFATEMLTLGVALTVFFAVVYPFIIRREEIELRAKFGAAFEVYAARVPRFFPRFSGYVEPATWSVNTRLFRRTMTDVIWFVWLAALIELIAAGREFGVITPLFSLP